MSDWTDNPSETGAYWFHVPGVGATQPEICWVHCGMVWFAPHYSSDESSVRQCAAKYGKCFWGPIPSPSLEGRA